MLLAICQTVSRKVASSGLGSKILVDQETVAFKYYKWIFDPKQN